MEFAKFAETGISISRLSLGTGQFGKQIKESDAYNILERAAEAGVNFIDTANMYPAGATAEEQGSSELIVGRWLKEKRSKFILGTKAGFRIGQNPWDQGGSRKHLLDAIDASLRRLNTDYVDLYQLHTDDMSTPIDETVEAMDTIVRSGKARYIGVSNFMAYRLARAIGKQDARRLARYVSVQPRYNLLFREIERELLPLAHEERLAVMPYNPLAGGLLSGKYKFSDNPEKGRFSREVGHFGAIYQARYWHEREFQTVNSLSELAKELGIPLSTLSIAWMLSNPTITSVILGATRVEQLTDTLAAVDFRLDSKIKERMNEISIEYRRGDSKE